MAVKKNILIIIPAYNEAKTIGRVVQDVMRHMAQADVLVVNDGSADSTAATARTAGALVIDLPFNVGIGAAMQAGYKYAFQNGYEIAVQCDGDGQHPPYQIKNLIAPLLDRKADFVIGSRFIKQYGYRSSVPRQIGIVLFSRLVSLITKAKVTDTTCGFRALNRRAIASFASYYPWDYPEVEALVLAYKEGLKIREVPVRIFPRKEGSSSIGFFGSCYYTIKVFLAVLIDLFEAAPVRKEA